MPHCPSPGVARCSVAKQRGDRLLFKVFGSRSSWIARRPLLNSVGSSTIIVVDLRPTGGKAFGPRPNIVRRERQRLPRWHLIRVIISEPSGYIAAVVASAASVTLIGASDPGQSVLSGTGPLTLQLSSGTGSVAVGGNGSWIATPTLGGVSYSIELDSNSDTIVAATGDVSIAALGAGNLIRLGSGQSILDAGSSFLRVAASTVIGGTGQTSVTAINSWIDLRAKSSAFVGLDTVFATGSTVIGGGGSLLVLHSSFISSGGNDVIILGAGATSIGNSSVDTIYAGSGLLDLVDPLEASTVYAGTGSVTINASGRQVQGASLYEGGSSGNNSIIASGHADTLLGAGNGDYLSTGFVGGDLLFAGSGFETLNGRLSGRSDTFVGSASGSARMIGGPGNDVFFAGTGFDTIVTATSSSGLGFGLNLIGTQSGQTLIFSGGIDTVLGGSGGVTVNGGPHGGVFAAGKNGSLLVNVGAAADTVFGDRGSATVNGGAGGGVFVGGLTGQNLLIGGSGIATILGMASGDTLIGGGSAGDLIGGGAGAETLVGSATGKDTIFAGSGNQSLIAGGGLDILVAGSGNDTFDLGSAVNLTGFFQGRSGGNEVIRNFQEGRSFLTLQNYGSNEVGRALGASTISGGNTMLALSDGTRITLINVTNLDSSAFI